MTMAAGSWVSPAAFPCRARLIESSEAALVNGAQGGDAAAFGELVRRYQDRVYTLVYGRLQSREDALDLTQEVFLKAHRKLGSFREDSVFGTWLYRITFNACIDWSRRQRARPACTSLNSAVLTQAGYEPVDQRVGSDPERSLVNKELGTVIRSCLESLPEAMRWAVLLHDLQGLSQEETAAAMGCPIGTAKSRIQRGRWQLRERLQEQLGA